MTGFFYQMIYIFARFNLFFLLLLLQVGPSDGFSLPHYMWLGNLSAGIGMLITEIRRGTVARCG